MNLVITQDNTRSGFLTISWPSVAQTPLHQTELFSWDNCEFIPYLISDHLVMMVGQLSWHFAVNTIRPS